MKKYLTLFENARESKILPNVVVSIIIFFLMIFIGQIIGGILTGLAALVFLPKNDLNYFNNLIEVSENPTLMILTFLFPILLCFLWVKLVEKRKISSLGLKRKGFFTKFIKGFGIGILLFSMVTLLMYIFGIISLEQGITTGIRFLPSILLLLPGWIIQSSMEEILTRGWLMNIVGARHKPIIGFIVSSLIFSFLHLLNPGIGVLSIVNIILIGITFGLHVIYTQDLWGACGIHAAWNFSQANLFGFSVSGLDVTQNSLIRFLSSGPDFLTGGQFGPEASIFSTLVILISITVLSLKIKNSIVK